MSQPSATAIEMWVMHHSGLVAVCQIVKHRSVRWQFSKHSFLHYHVFLREPHVVSKTVANKQLVRDVFQVHCDVCFDILCVKQCQKNFFVLTIRGLCFACVGQLDRHSCSVAHCASTGVLS